METIYLLSIVLGALLATYFYLKKKYTYWEERGVATVEPEFFFGNIRPILKKQVNFGQHIQSIYKELKAKGCKYGGFYNMFTPVFLTMDPEITKYILQKDFDHFTNRGLYLNEKSDPLSGHLVKLEDAKWKNLRSKLTPTFTSGKMRLMFQVLLNSSNSLKDLLRDHSIRNDAVDIKEILARFTTDVIGSCAFGLECNSLNDPDTEFRKFGRKIFHNPTLTNRVKQIMLAVLPWSILRGAGFKQTSTDIEDFFMKVVKDTVEYREKNHVARKDFMDLLLQLRNKGNVSDEESTNEEVVNGKSDQRFLTINEIAAQCFVFFAAGFETSSTAMTFALYELAVNKNIQEKLREDILSALKRHDNKVTYDSIMEMNYLDKIINESMRKYPPIPGVPRVCNKTYAIPGTNVVIERGIRVHVPIMSIHNDSEYYPNPEIFDPERFSEENKAKRPAFTYLPFGDGPRICIGLRFGLMQAKVGLVTIIRDFEITLHEKTKTPIELDSRPTISSIKGDLWLRVSKRD